MQLSIFSWKYLQEDVCSGTLVQGHRSVPQNGQTHPSNLSAVADELFKCV